MRPQRCSTSPNDASSSAIGTSITAPVPSTSRLRKRGGDRERGGEPRDLVGHRVGDVRGLAGHPLLRAGDARHRLHGVVVRGEVGVGTVVAEADDRAVHERGMTGGEGLRVGTAPLGRVASHVVHDDVGAVGELAQLRATVVRREVEHDAALAPVAVEEHRAHARVDARSEIAGEVAGRRLDLDHVGAEVGEQQRAVRPGDHRGEVDDAHAVEREPDTGGSYAGLRRP